MHSLLTHRALSRLFAVIGILLGLLLAGERIVIADDAEQPSNVTAIADAPGWVTVYWDWGATYVAGFTVDEKTLGSSTLLDNSVRQYTAMGLQPSHPYQFRVCAVLIDASSVCSDYRPVTTSAAAAAGTDCTQIPIQAPFFTDHSAGDTWIDVTWHTNGHCYQGGYFLNYEVKAAPGSPRNPVQDVHEPPGRDNSWGGHRLEGLLAATTYVLSVQGCDLGGLYGAFGNICADWSPVLEVTTTGRKGDDWRTKWTQLDNNAATRDIVADGDKLYQQWSGGQVFQYTGQPCNGNTCTGWTPLDNNPATVQIVAGGGHLYQRWSSGGIWQYTGRPCSGTTCTGWQQLDNNASTAQIVADGDKLYQRWSNGAIWLYTGTPCQGTTCSGWQQLDNNSSAAQIAAAGGHLYERWSGGGIWQYTGQPCNGNTCTGWQQLDNNAATAVIVADGDKLYQRWSSGGIWQYTNQPCNGNTCTGWQQLDNNAATAQIAAAGGHLYQRWSSGQIWQYSGTPCQGTTCTGWTQLDDNTGTVWLAADGDDLYQLHSDGQAWKHNR